MAADVRTQAEIARVFVSVGSAYVTLAESFVCLFYLGVIIENATLRTRAILFRKTNVNSLHIVQEDKR
jgi:hypothetical protein